MKKILIVDDNQQNLYLLQTLLGGFGYEVASAVNGAEALEKAARELPDLVVADILMPVMDGFELCRRWKKDETLKKIPFVFYTATYTDPRDEEFALSLGAERFVVKPQEPEVLVGILKEVFASERNPGPLLLEHASIDDVTYIKGYNEALIRKLEDKMIELEKANQVLEHEIGERKRTEAKLLEKKGHLLEAQRIAKMGDFTWDFESGEIKWSETLYELFGYEKDEVITYETIYEWIRHPEDRDSVQEWIEDAIASGSDEISPNEYRVNRKNGEMFFIRTLGVIRRRPGLKPVIFATVQDITAKKQAEIERERLHDQLIQAQKMDAVGRLAGGVAHDFNNMLSVILGHSELAIMKTSKGNPIYENLLEIQSAAKRSADITRQLLAFARKQTIHPRVIKLNDTIEGTLKMLRRLIGEDIDLLWKPRNGLWKVRIDPIQIDQILANLCVNSRDAIKGNGKVTIETDNVTIDRDFCAENSGCAPGDFVMLAVSDNGCGLHKEALANLFEPFFTTKAVGEGTGLGLATVYGIVKQNDGFIIVYSEPGNGTTFKIYFPRQEHPVGVEEEEELPDIPPGRGESVLIVEDESAILKFSLRMLSDLGYNVLTASSPSEAVRIVTEKTCPVRLLITDVVMPEMNGRELAEALQKICPELKVLFMSGYTADVIAHRGILEEGVHFIQKPFNKSDLARKLRQVLESPEPAPGIRSRNPG